MIRFPFIELPSDHDLHRQLLAAFAESFGLTVLRWNQPHGHTHEHMTALVRDPVTGEEGEIRMPTWLLDRLVRR